ncbi:MAG: oligosaccharide repeat unit polymerase [Gammaproteobacteria bacterium]|nr:oligosaccharide repeat unit polymerase [Gammaproteobacteria bacterium]
MFFGDIFFHDYSLEISLIYVFLIMSFVVVLMSFVAILGPNRLGSAINSFDGTHHNNDVLVVGYKLFWLFSIPALVSQVWMIQLLGGFEGYVNSLELRVVTHRGFGWLTSIIRTFSVINLIYFSYLVTRNNRNKRDIAKYVLHFMIFLFLALLTGSRGSLLVNLVLMFLIYHYSVQRISLRWLISFAVSLVLAASVLGVVRQNISLHEGVLVLGLSKESQNTKKMSFKWAKYGLIPIDLVLKAENVKKHYGFTYLTFFTNFVPRTIWPTKPDTGGVVLTKEYTGNAWGGYSNLSTGILAEAIINFGPFMGLLVGFLQFSVMIGWVLRYYIRFRRRMMLNSPYQFIYSVRFAYVSWAMAGLIVGEFTNTMVSLAIQLITVWVAHRLIRLFSHRPVHRHRING